ncbi:MAG: TonB-dependent receptor [Myxococcota bacterium]
MGAASAQQSGSVDDPFAGVEEMVVTGSSTKDLLNPTSTSAIVFDASDLANAGVQDVSDLDAYVPNLEITSVNATNASFFIRGVGLQDFGANASSSVPIYQDGIPRNASATQLVGLFDVGGISVLKGPQGSKHFRNASAGAFVLQTRLPEPEFSGSASVSISQIASVDARDAQRYTFEAAMNAPVYEDVVSARVAMRFKHENPFFENRCANRIPLDQRVVSAGVSNPAAQICGERIASGQTSGVNPFLSRYLGEIDDFGVRGTLRVDPADAPIEFVVRVETSRLNRDSTTGQAIGTSGGFLGASSTNFFEADLLRRRDAIVDRLRAETPTLSLIQARLAARPILEREVRREDGLDRGPYAGDLNRPGRTILDTHAISTTTTLDTDFAQTKLNLGFLDYRKSEFRDTDLTSNTRFDGSDNDQAFQLYGDLSFERDAIGAVPIEWSTGVYSIYEKLEGSTKQDLFGRLNVAEGGTAIERDYSQTIKGFGIFGEAAYDITEEFTLSGGIRYNWERKDFAIVDKDLRLGFNGEVIAPPGVRGSNQRTWDGFSGFVNLEYRFTEEISTYIKYSRGFKAGHFNPSDSGVTDIPGQGFADPERIDAVEVGTTASFWADRVRASAAFFFYNYRNLQVFRISGSIQGFARVVNSAEQARNLGIELDLSVRPLEGFVPESIEGLNVSFSGGWLEAKFVEFSVLEQRLVGVDTLGIPIDFSGNTLLNSPQLKVTASVDWPFDVGRFGILTPHYDLTWTDDTPFDPNNGKGEPSPVGDSQFPAYAIGARAYILHNVRLTWVPPNDPGVEVSGWCRNVTDQRYKNFSVDLSTFDRNTLNFVGDPRVCGADLRFKW